MFCDVNLMFKIYILYIQYMCSFVKNQYCGETSCVFKKATWMDWCQFQLLWSWGEALSCLLRGRLVFQKTVSEGKIWIMRVQIPSCHLRGRPLYLGKAMLQRIFQCFHICHSIKPFGWIDYSDSDKGPCTDYASEANHHSTWGKPPSRLLAWPAPPAALVPTSALTSVWDTRPSNWLLASLKTWYTFHYLAGSWTLEQSP